MASAGGGRRRFHGTNTRRGACVDRATGRCPGNAQALPRGQRRHHHNHRPTEKAAVVVGRQFDVGGLQRTALRGPAQSGDAGGVNAGLELAKLTTIFANSTSKSTKAANPQTATYGSGANSRRRKASRGVLSRLQAWSTAFHTAGASRPWTPRRPSPNCPLRMRCINSMPAIVIAAVAKPLKPSIVAIRCFTPRWSCSIRLFKYFDDRSFVSAGSKPSAFGSRTAR